MISLEPALSESGQRVYRIVFSSNAPDAENFDGVEIDGMDEDANTEIWIYTLPPVADVDLSLGADLPVQDLNLGAFKKVRETPASRPPTPGSSTAAPFFADDNREPAISDDGNIIAFISTRNLVPGVGNADSNPELFFYNVATDTVTQGTNTQDPTPGVGTIFQSNPTLSADGSIVSFLSSANLAANNSDTNAEVYLANFGAGALTNIRQITRTVNGTFNANVFSPGRRMSRNGAFIAFESRVTDPKANATVSNQFPGMFVYTVATDTFVELITRTNFDDLIRFPTFTDYNEALNPSTLVFASRVNFRPDGTLPLQAQASEGLNPLNESNIFSAPLPPASTGPFTRLTNVPNDMPEGTKPIPSESRRRIAFVHGADLGGGNADFSNELFYLLTPQINSVSSAVLSFFTGLGQMPVAAATPLPSPTPSPTPTPSPVPGSPAGLAPGQLSIVRSTVALAPSDRSACPDGPVLPCASVSERAPALPIELNGVSVSVGGAAAGLVFVGNESKQINFVIPITVPVGVATVAVANNGTLLRGHVQIVPGQPDISTTSADGVGGRAGARDAVLLTPEPFDAGRTIQLSVSGVRGATRTEITVTVGTTVISGDAIVAVQPTDTPGFDIINFTLPASLAGAGDVPVVVTFTRTGGFSATSRPAATAPHITIN